MSRARAAIAIGSSFIAVVLSVDAGTARIQAPARGDAPPVAFSIVEASIDEMRAAMESGRVTSRELVRQSLARIAKYDPLLHATLAVSRRALQNADALDRERRLGRVRGPLHGIPIALKDNIQTTDMPTTAGALALRGFVPPYEATVTANLRAAGAVIIAKTSMTELANWIAGPPTPMPNGYNAIRGFGYNPYDPDFTGASSKRAPPALDPGGSSSGAGTAASLWAANVGTETSGSILFPSSQTMLVGIKPTVGRISRYGVAPIAAEQDTPGPMARSVADAAILLGALEGTTPDAHDPATKACEAPPGHDYRPFLKRQGLRGARIGIPRAFFYDALPVAGRPAGVGGLSDLERRGMNDVMAVLQAEGAVIVDPADVPSVTERDLSKNLLSWGICAQAGDRRGADDMCSIVLKYGMKRDFNAWLKTLGARVPVKSLTALRTWNRAHVRDGAIRYGQSVLDISDEVDLVRDRARQQTDRARDVLLTATHGIDEIMAGQRLDALLFPGSSGAMLAARAGYPTVIVPFGFLSLRPVGISFTGTACSEPRLIEIAYAFEQATHRRVPPTATP